MVKHVALIIGCVILSFSVTLIVPTSCSPIVEQKVANVTETRSKRSASALAAADATSASSSTQLLTLLLPFLKLKPPPMLAMSSKGLGGYLQGISPALLEIIGPILDILGGTVGGLGGTLDSTLEGVGGDLGALSPTLGGLGGILETLLGGGALPMGKPMGKGGPPPKAGIASLSPLLSIMESAKSKASAKTTETISLAG